MAAHRQNYYTNPAFCQKSENYPQDGPHSPRQRALSPERRHPPIGAQKPIQIENNNPSKQLMNASFSRQNQIQKSFGNEEEYEEMLVDDSSCSPKKSIDIAEDIENGNRITTFINGNETEIIQTKKGRYAIVKVDDDFCEPQNQKNRYEYIPMQEQVVRTQRTIKKLEQNQRYISVPSEEEQSGPQRVAKRPNQRRYTEIPSGGFEEQNKSSRPNHGRYAEIPPQGFEENQKARPSRATQGRYAEIPPQSFEVQKRSGSIENLAERKTQDCHPNQGRYAEIPQSYRYGTVPVHEESFKRLPDRQKHRYEYIPNDEEQVLYQDERRFPQTPKKGNREATQKLHELLITPEKFTRPNNPQRILSPPKKDPFQTPTKSPPKILSPRSQPKAQQKLNYAISTRQNIYDKRQNTAIITPICSSPVQSVYSETTFSNKTESWLNLSLQKRPVQATLAVAAIMMMLCGGLSSALCFYMVSIVGRMYYLDFGIISGFACLLLGCLGFRGRYCHWLPNRNYISGYIVLSAFSLLTCAGLLVLLFLQPKPGSPLADVTSGAVCGISGLSLILASTGVIASYCCKYPPPDNRVQHAAQGFTV